MLDTAIIGDAEPVTLHQRAEMRRFHDSRTLAEACASLAVVFGEVALRACPIYNVVHRAADSDPQIAALEQDLDRQRLTGSATWPTRLPASSMPPTRRSGGGSGTRCGCSAPRCSMGYWYTDRGWSVAAYQTWMEHALRSLVPGQADSRD